MIEEHKCVVLNVDAILDSCVLAEGKRWYQVKWSPAWVTDEELPIGILDAYKTKEVTHHENDGVYYVSDDRKSEDGLDEYLLCRGNTWESEEKLDNMDKNIVINYWSQQSDLKEIVKVEEDFGEYNIKTNYVNTTLKIEEDLDDFNTEPLGNTLIQNDVDPLVNIKEEELHNDIEDGHELFYNLNEQTLLGQADYQCAKCNSLFVTGQMKDFVTNESTKSYKTCQRCGEKYCSRCSISMGELRFNGKTSLFCDVCINGFAGGTSEEKNNKERKTIPNEDDKASLVGSSWNCEKCSKPFLSHNHQEFMFTSNNMIQCTNCIEMGSYNNIDSKSVSSHVPHQYFMPLVVQPISQNEAEDSQIDDFSEPNLGQGRTGIRVLSGNHKNNVRHKGILSNQDIKTDEDDNQDFMTDVIETEPSTPIEDIEDAKDHTIGEYKCEDCGRMFNRQYTLDTHRRIHTGEKPYVCEVCGARFRQSGTKLNHVRAVHTKERPFQCQYCGKTFSHKSSITVHIRIHTKEKPYQCQTCERCFTDRATYLKHQSIHSGVKPYGCPMCSRKFSQKSNLKRHYKNVHEEGKPNTRTDNPKSTPSNLRMTGLPELAPGTRIISVRKVMPGEVVKSCKMSIKGVENSVKTDISEKGIIAQSFSSSISNSENCIITPNAPNLSNDFPKVESTESTECANSVTGVYDTLCETPAPTIIMGSNTLTVKNACLPE